MKLDFDGQKKKGKCENVHCRLHTTTKLGTSKYWEKGIHGRNSLTNIWEFTPRKINLHSPDRQKFSWPPWQNAFSPMYRPRPFHVKFNFGFLKFYRRKRTSFIHLLFTPRQKKTGHIRKGQKQHLQNRSQNWKVFSSIFLKSVLPKGPTL